MKTATNRVMMPVMLACLAGAAQAQPLATERFEYPAGNSLLGQSGGLGFASPWQTAGYGSWSVNANDEVVIRNGLLLSTAGGRSQSALGGAQRTLATPIAGTTGTSAWISFVARRVSGTSGTSWLGVKLPSTGPAPFLFLGQPFGRSHWGADNGLAGGIAESSSPADVAHIVCRIDFRAGADDVRVWINPNLDADPADSTATLTLPAYGDFQNITKLIIETGASVGSQVGAVDELRIGSSFAEVAPVEQGSAYKGKKVKPKPDSKPCLECFSWGLSQQGYVRSNPGTVGPFGVDIEMESVGAVVGISPGDFPPGSSVRHKHKGWDGVIYGNPKIISEADRTVAMDLDFPGAAALNVVVREADGTILTDETTPGQARFKNLGGVVNPWGPCPDGSFPYWKHTIVFYDPPKLVNSQYVYFEWVWTFGCGGSSGTERTITTTPLFDDGNLPLVGTGTLELEAAGPMSSLTLVDCADMPLASAAPKGGGLPHVPRKDALVRGLGNVLVSSSCDDGTQCPDQERRRLRAVGIGSSGEDGVGVDWKPSNRDGSGGSVSFDDIQFSNGEAVLSRTGIDATGVLQQLDSISVTGSNGASTIVPDFSNVGSTQYSVTGYDASGTVVIDAVFPNGTPLTLDHVICPPNQQLIWGWYTYWYWTSWPTTGHWRTDWVVIGCGSLGTPGGGGNTSTERIVIQPVNPTPSEPVSVDIRARNIPAGAFTLSLDADMGNPCPVDFDGDGFVDFFDFDAFVSAFENGEPNADFDEDGFIDFFDFDAYVSAFEVGC